MFEIGQRVVIDVAGQPRGRVSYPEGGRAFVVLDGGDIAAWFANTALTPTAVAYEQATDHPLDA